MELVSSSDNFPYLVSTLYKLCLWYTPFGAKLIKQICIIKQYTQEMVEGETL